MLKKKVIIYGIGNYYREMKEQIDENYEVVARTDINRDSLEGISSIETALSFSYDIIIVMIQDIQTCFEVIKMLIKEHRIPYNKIVLGLNISSQNRWDSLDINEEGDILFKVDGLSIITKNIDEFNNVKDIFCGDCYNYFLNDKTEEIVLDIGMNIGGASLYFESRANVVKVYGFEPFPDTFAEAEENFKLNGVADRKSIEYFSYGVRDVNEHRKVIYNRNMTCGQSTDVEANEKARKSYKEWKLISEGDDKIIEVEVKDIKDILSDIYQIHKGGNVILKLDCEGEEYRIMKRLEEFSLFTRIKVIMLEWHYGKEKDLIEILKRNQYMYWSFAHERNMGGLIYAFKEN